MKLSTVNSPKGFDIIFVMPYLFSDHPSFPEGVLKRALEVEGFTVGVLETPFWQDVQSFTACGRPRLFFAIIPGPVDSVVLNYTSTRKRRMEDLYQADGKAFFPDFPPSIKYKIRPDRTVMVFANRIRQAYKDTPIVIGGIEASLRRFVHYDFQEDQLRRSILLDTRADILVSGMGEKQIVEIARKAAEGKILKNTDIPGTARIVADTVLYPGYQVLPSYEEILANHDLLLDAALKTETAAALGQGLIQEHNRRFIVDHPAPVYTAAETDTIYNQPYTRLHIDPTVLSPALQMNQFSITSHRGCGGGCSFCSISMHEGKRIVSRSEESILEEIRRMQKHPHWKGVVSDIGGGTAEFYGADCRQTPCPKVSCLHKKNCPSLTISSRFRQLLHNARALPGVRQVFLGSGIRYDIMLRHPELLEDVMENHCGKFLRVAPEHTEDAVLDLMRKPRFQQFEEFVYLFNRINSRLKRKIQLAPYLIVGFPGETFQDVMLMKRRLRPLGTASTDAQIFTPSPGTVATAMYFTGKSPHRDPIPVEKSIKALMKRKEMLTQG